ncbi:hypothetical protein NESM_000203000 [Novymonas esmeraldas]|uniref:Uncharacterized protein n=1 Tax=Novymonas esmeraldas TaxID=1808958 RepID=A0AAW0F5G3_9TRYP
MGDHGEDDYDVIDDGGYYYVGVVEERVNCSTVPTPPHGDAARSPTTAAAILPPLPPNTSRTPDAVSSVACPPMSGRTSSARVTPTTNISGAGGNESASAATILAASGRLAGMLEPLPPGTAGTDKVHCMVLQPHPPPALAPPHVDDVGGAPTANSPNAAPPRRHTALHPASSPRKPTRQTAAVAAHPAAPHDAPTGTTAAHAPHRVPSYVRMERVSVSMHSAPAEVGSMDEGDDAHDTVKTTTVAVPERPVVVSRVSAHSTAASASSAAQRPGHASPAPGLGSRSISASGITSPPTLAATAPPSQSGAPAAAAAPPTPTSGTGSPQRRRARQSPSVDTEHPLVASALLPPSSLPPASGATHDGSATATPTRMRTPAEVPPWLAQVNTALMERTLAMAVVASQESDAISVPDSGLAQHRTVSQMSPSAEDWLNPCSRPTAAAVPGVSSYSRRGIRVGSPAGAMDTTAGWSTAASRAQLSAIDAGSVSSPGSVADANGGEGVSWLEGRRRYAAFAASVTATNGDNDSSAALEQPPSQRTSTAVSLRSTVENGDFIPISREQRAMTPHSQRCGSSGLPSLENSCVGDVEASLSGSGSGGLGRPPLAGARRASLNSQNAGSHSSDATMAPLRLRRGSNGSDSSTSAVGTAGKGVLAAMGGHTSTPPLPLPMASVARGGHAPAHPAPPASRAVHPVPSRSILSMATATTAPSLTSGELHRLCARPVSPLRMAVPTDSVFSSAPSLLSNNDGPSAVALPLARFPRYSLSSSTAGHPAGSSSAAAADVTATQRRASHTVAPSAAHEVRRNGPPVLSLAPQGRSAERERSRAVSLPSPLRPEAATVNVGGRPLPWYAPPALNSTPDPAQQQQQQQQQQQCGGESPYAPHDANDASYSHSDALASVSCATSAASLAAETQFVRYRN